MLNIFRTKKALKQAKQHVEEVNALNDELTRIGKEQNEIIAEQQAKIASLTKQIEGSDNHAVK